jgi:metacaspase-1
MSGRSIHIGLNHVDSNHYTDEHGDPWSGTLKGCVNDANAMQRIADLQGCSPQVKLLNEDATVAAVSGAIEDAAKSLQYGELLVVTYSGHGGQVPDLDGDEPDSQDETWVLFDRELLDDELNALWSQFSAGVRILVVSDSCHSGSVARMRLLQRFYAATREIRDAKSLSVLVPRGDDPPRHRYMPAPVADATFARHEALYRAAHASARAATRGQVQANLILFSGCQDSQFSYDGDSNGAFTEKLLATWDDGSFTGTHRKFLDATANGLRPDQTPNYSTYGEPNPLFEAQTPFTVDAPAGGGDAGGSGAGGQGTSIGPAPAVRGPDTYAPGDPPPSFTVNPGVGRWFVFEITSDGSLFDPDNAWQRTADSFYASWQDGDRYQGSSYTLPGASWDRLKQHSTLVYRIGTTTSQTGWPDYQVSTAASSWWDAPSMSITDTPDDWDGRTGDRAGAASLTRS